MTTSTALKKLRTETARSFIRDITNENDIFYVFLGRTQVWGTPDVPPSMTPIPTPTPTPTPSP